MSTVTTSIAMVVASVAPVGWAISVRAGWQLRRQLRTDRLTGLPNRDAMIDAFTRATRRQRGGAVGVLLLDLDGFKQVNDLHGHAAGNEVLRHVGARLTTLAKASHRLRPVRLHGDEFAVLLTDLPAGAVGLDMARCFAAQVTDTVGTPLVWAYQPITPSASVGMAVTPVEHADLSTLLHAADQRMYANKRRASVAMDELAGHVAGSDLDKNDEESRRALLRSPGGAS
jgi:diguanylate cyclase (GGDEF)-like protein